MGGPKKFEKWSNNEMLGILTKCLGKIWILSFGPKTLSSVKMQDSLILNCNRLQ